MSKTESINNETKFEENLLKEMNEYYNLFSQDFDCKDSFIFAASDSDYSDRGK